MDINEKCRKLPVLKKCEKYLCDKDEHYLYYKEKVSQWVEMFYNLGLDDGNYIRNIDTVRKKPVHELTRDEVLTRMTYIMRSSRHGGDGFDTSISDGTFESLCYQLHFCVYLQEKGE